MISTVVERSICVDYENLQHRWLLSQHQSPVVRMVSEMDMAVVIANMMEGMNNISLSVVHFAAPVVMTTTFRYYDVDITHSSTLGWGYRLRNIIGDNLTGHSLESLSVVAEKITSGMIELFNE